MSQSSIEAGLPDRVMEVRERAATVRRETIRLVGIAKSGHYSSVFSCAEILAALYSGVMRIAEDPEWPERDLRVTAIDAHTGRFRVFSREDDVPLLYAVAASCAVPGVYPPITNSRD